MRQTRDISLTTTLFPVATLPLTREEITVRLTQAQKHVGGDHENESEVPAFPGRQMARTDSDHPDPRHPVPSGQLAHPAVRARRDNTSEQHHVNVLLSPRRWLVCLSADQRRGLPAFPRTPIHSLAVHIAIAHHGEITGIPKRDEDGYCG